MRKKLHDGARVRPSILWFQSTDCLFASPGADSFDTIATHLVGDVKDRARDEMAGRTGETDSEMSGAD